MIKYAICYECLDKNHSYLARPWISAGAKTFKFIHEVPKDHILISIWPAFRSPVKEWAASGGSFIEIDYGYWGNNSPRRDTRRVTYNSSHNIRMKPAPWSRINTLSPKIMDWNKRPGEYLLLIEPNGPTLTERTGLNMGEWQRSVLEKINEFWDGPVRWRRKKGGKNQARWPSFLEDLKNCHMVIGERTMACAEAVILGYPAITLDKTITSLVMGDDLGIIKNLIYPDRTQWLEHVAWSQFHYEEFDKGTAVVEMVEHYQINF